MANTIDTTQAAPFIPEIWANEALPTLRSNVQVARLVARDTDFASFRKGDILNIQNPGTLAASAKSAGTEYTLAQPSGEANIAVALDQHWAVSFVIEDIVTVQANPDLVRTYAAAAMEALAGEIEDSLIALFTGFSTNVVGAYGTDLDAADFRTIRKNFNDSKAPMSGRVAVISTKDEIALMADTTLEAYFANAKPEVVAAGALAELYGTRIFVSNRIATDTVANPDETVNSAFHRDAMILAMRDLPAVPAGLGAVSHSVIDPESGLQFRVVMSYDARLGGVQVTYEALWGVKELRDALGQLVRS